MERFWSKVHKTDTCWEWMASRDQNGYGQFRIGAKRGPIKAHRWAWIEAHGPILDRLLVLHHCDNPPCVRPDHLFLGTYKDNMQDAKKKGRIKGGQPPGDGHPGAKITTAKAQAIRAIGRSKLQREIAEEFGLAQETVSDILLGKIWKNDEETG